MKVVVALLLNAAFLAVLLPWLWRQWRPAGMWVRAALAFGLGARLVVGMAAARHLLYDAYQMSRYSRPLTAQLWADPPAALAALWGNELHYAGYHLVYYGMSNTFFFIKLLGWLNLASLGTDMLNAGYLSVFSFVGCWHLARALARAFPRTPAGASVLALVVWPSVVFWTSGVSKESVLLSSGAWLLAMCVELFFGTEKWSKTRCLGAVAGALALALLHFKMRYFFAVPLLGALVGLAVVCLLQRLGLARSRAAQVLVLLAVLGGGAWLASEVSVAFRANKFTNQIVRIYTQDLVASAGKPHFEYPDLQPTLASIGRHTPQAAANALTRPWLGESKKAIYVVAGLENALLLALLALALVAAWRGRVGHLPFGLTLVLLIHCVALAVLLGLSTPNLGSLHRYRSGLLPYLLLLLLQNDYVAAGLRRLGIRNETGWPPVVGG